MTFINASNAKSEQIRSEYTGTPRSSVNAKISGAFLSLASPYRVLVAIYKSEFAAEKTKSNTQPLMKPGRWSMPASWIATTKGEAEALLPCLVAKRSSGALCATFIPRRRTLRT